MCGKLLLVGEGDFSFAVSLVEKLPSNNWSGSLATSFETEETIKKHRNAVVNIEKLQKHGVDVQLSTDGTQLHTDIRFSGKDFDCIIFNFPHAGGKSNHKKNRKLLNDFFESAVQVLATKGQILMTLCKGQGGTPADQPMRAWHDSWQVVSMAANASLILVNIIPFRAEEHTAYTSTGFRSLDKGFLTENALTHVFELAQPVELPVHVDGVPLRLGDDTFLCPLYLYRKLHQIKKISENRDHPVNRIYCMIHQYMKSTHPNLHVEELGMFPPIRKSTIATVEEHCTCKKDYQLQTESSVGILKGDDPSPLKLDIALHSVYKLKKIDSLACSSDHFVDDSFEDLLDGDGRISSSQSCLTLISDCLHICRKNFRSLGLYTGYAPIFKPCIISSWTSPVSYHMISGWPIKREEKDVRGAERSPLYGEHLFMEVQNLICFLERMLGSLVGKVDFKLLVDLQLLRKPEADNCDSSFLHIMDIFLPADCTAGNSESEITSSVKPLTAVFLHYLLNSDSSECIVTMNLSKLACLRHHIRNERLLWSEDPRVLSQFSNRNCCSSNMFDNGDSSVISGPEGANKENTIHTISARGNPATELSGIKHTDHVSDTDSDFDVSLPETLTIKSPSLYPMTFTHDMSFWENPSIEFDELKFCGIIRNIADDNVTGVELIDIYTDTISHKVSRCYRLTFQSIDKALSYNTSWKLQSVIRLQVEKEMQISLR